jgi:hypothetical protein
MKRYGILTIIVFFSSSIHAANCIPKVTDNKVTIEYFDGEGNIVHSETHKVRSKKKYKGLVSNDKAFKELVKDTTGNIKIRSSKLELKSGGMTTKVSKKDGTSLAKIGGCPVSKLKFYKRIGKQKSPFIHKSLIKAASKAEVQPASNETTRSSANNETNRSSTKSRLATREAQRIDAAESRSIREVTTNSKSSETPVAANQPTTNAEKRNNVSSNKGGSGTPWKEVSAPINDVHGWFGVNGITVISPTHVSNRGSHYQTIELFAEGTFSLSGRKSFCMSLHYDQGISLKSRERVDNKKLAEELKKIESLKSQFVKFNNLRLVDIGFTKGQACTFSSITKADFPPKTRAHFTLKENAQSFLKYSIVGQSGTFYLTSGIGYNYDKPEVSTLRFEKAHLFCRSGIAWSSTKNFKAIKKRIENGEFDNINAAEVELVGLAQSPYQQMFCEVDDIKVKKLN